MKKKALMGLVLGGVLASAGILYGEVARRLPLLPSYDQVRVSYQSSDLFLLDRDHKVLHQWRQDNKSRSFAWSPLSEISPAMIHAVLKSEDKYFYQHPGFDTKAFMASVYQRIAFNSPRGGSTISMQLAKLMSPQKAIYAGMLGKVRQVLAARRLEAKWSKDQILEAYLNLTPFRSEYRGLASISWAFFDKMPLGLSQKEATLLSVLIRSPNATAQDWITRACRQEPQLCTEFHASVPAILDKSKALVPSGQYALHLAQRLSASGVQGEIVTSVQQDLQRYVQEIIASQMRELELRNVQEAAVLVVENSTGQVWAYVGGNGKDESRKYVDGVQALRQAGSTLKPFLYASAFEKDILHAHSWIEDSPVDIIFESGVYKPQNHDRQFYGWVPVRTALGSSLNVPAVKVFKLLNDETFWTKLKEMNFRKLQPPDHYGPALALGVADVSLEDLTQAYRTLAQGGVYSELRYDLGTSTESKRVFSAESVAEVTSILSRSENRTLGFGLDSVLDLPGTAVKTGTSKDMRDNWCVGFNQRFTVGVWVGNFSGAPMWNVMGVTGAAPIWKKTMLWLNEKYPPLKPVEVLRNNAEVETKPQTYPQTRITYPQDGTILALDPGIPAQNQKMPLIISSPEPEKMRWKINGGPKVSAASAYLWTPTVGRHTFELYQDNDLKDRVQILVK
ncbi:MAG: penicillin-binding protein 1C [Bdellovibrio sp.]|nr:penicillin-binding protein 1C [Bdellovibrio sp.]